MPYSALLLKKNILKKNLLELLELLKKDVVVDTTGKLKWKNGAYLKIKRGSYRKKLRKVKY